MPRCARRRTVRFRGPLTGGPRHHPQEPHMLRSLLVRWIVVAIAFAITAGLLDGMDLSGGVTGALWIALVFGIVNAVIGTVLRILTLPLTVITLGLFSIIVNAFLLVIVDAISSDLTIDSFFWTAIWAAIILSFVGVIVDVLIRAILPGQRSRR
jgi:putative membrane protein